MAVLFVLNLGNKKAQVIYLSLEYYYGAGGTRTHTPFGQRFLRPSCLPFHHNPTLDYSLILPLECPMSTM